MFSAAAPVFQSVRRPGSPLTERAVNFILKEAAERASINRAASIHWLRHARASHAIDNGGTIEAGSPAELVTVWRAFLAPVARGMYVALYRGSILGLEPADEASYTALAA
jgi:hypothetical protein